MYTVLNLSLKLPGSLFYNEDKLTTLINLNYTQVTYLSTYRDSNQGPSVYEPEPLPIELTGIT